MKFPTAAHIVAHVKFSGISRQATIKGETEMWDFGSDEFVLETWEQMTFGGVRVEHMPWGFGFAINDQYIQAEYHHA